jgi:HSP20 family molecular chaperone IbpA
MTNDPKKPFLDGLDGLLGKLGDALNEAVQRLDQGQSDHVQDVNTPKGVLRTSSSLRVRVGGLDIAKAAATPKPVNPNRVKPAPTKTLAYDLFEDADAWILTAELPGVSLPELSLTQSDGTLTLRTTGARSYHAQIPMPCATDTITPDLHNGILTLHFPKGAA